MHTKTPIKEITLLLIDFDKALTDVLAQRLDGVGFNVLVANTADMGSKLTLASMPDLILLDNIMHTQDGKDILTTIKTNPQSTHIPVIILTSDDDVDSKAHTFLSEANDYIVKPFHFPEVLARIHTQLRITSMQQELTKKNQELREKNILLEKLATTDALTGLFNRSHILERLKTEVQRASRYHEFVSIIMIDIDYFKKINDTFGHLTGDAVLKMVANLLKTTVRDVDIVGRYGGEEFIIICPNTDQHGSKILGDRIRQNILQHDFEIPEKILKVTLSLGICSSIPASSENIELFITRHIALADRALYQAKTSGRNRVEIANDDPSEHFLPVLEKELPFPQNIPSRN